MADSEDNIVYLDLFGIPQYFKGPIEGMLAPVECKFCLQVHDSAKVDVLQRYSDCSVWKCPNCGTRIDDRPQPLGSAIPIRER